MDRPRPPSGNASKLLQRVPLFICSIFKVAYKTDETERSPFTFFRHYETVSKFSLFVWNYFCVDHKVCKWFTFQQRLEFVHAASSLARLSGRRPSVPCLPKTEYLGVLPPLGFSVLFQFNKGSPCRFSLYLSFRKDVFSSLSVPILDVFGIVSLSEILFFTSLGIF